jgi:hypothetical protein
MQAGAPPKQTTDGSARAQRTDLPGYLLFTQAIGASRRWQMPWPSWNARCPVGTHEDANPSVIIDYKNNGYGERKFLAWCRTCKANLSAMCEALGLDVHRVLSNNATLDREYGQRPPKPLGSLPTPADIVRWQRQLATDVAAMHYLREKRGLTPSTIRKHHIGYDGERYTLPVYDPFSLVPVNLRRYSPDSARKMIGLAGRTSKHLYPSIPLGEWVLLCEGEWDALLARECRLPSVTSTGGVGCWDEQWTQLLRGRDVAIVYDCDDAGRLAAARRAEEIRGVARKVAVVDLGLDDHEDLSDWFLKYGCSRSDLKGLITAAARG